MIPNALHKPFYTVMRDFEIVTIEYFTPSFPDFRIFPRNPLFPLFSLSSADRSFSSSCCRAERYSYVIPNRDYNANRWEINLPCSLSRRIKWFDRISDRRRRRWFLKTKVPWEEEEKGRRTGCWTRRRNEVGRRRWTDSRLDLAVIIITIT